MSARYYFRPPKIDLPRRNSTQPCRWRLPALISAPRPRSPRCLRGSVNSSKFPSSPATYFFPYPELNCFLRKYPSHLSSSRLVVNWQFPYALLSRLSKPWLKLPMVDITILPRTSAVMVYLPLPELSILETNWCPSLQPQPKQRSGSRVRPPPQPRSTRAGQAVSMFR
jgi:hypothetical protein